MIFLFGIGILLGVFFLFLPASCDLENPNTILLSILVGAFLIVICSYFCSEEIIKDRCADAHVSYELVKAIEKKVDTSLTAEEILVICAGAANGGYEPELVISILDPNLSGEEIMEVIKYSDALQTLK